MSKKLVSKLWLGARIVGRHAKTLLDMVDVEDVPNPPALQRDVYEPARNDGSIKPGDDAYERSIEILRDVPVGDSLDGSRDGTQPVAPTSEDDSSRTASGAANGDRKSDRTGILSFQCRVCGHDSYTPVDYRSSLPSYFACNGCTTLFSNPGAYSTVPCVPEPAWSQPKVQADGSAGD